MQPKQTQLKFNTSGNYDRCNLNDYSVVYRNKSLANDLNFYEKKFKLIDQSYYFKNLVNISQSNKYPFHSWFRYREGYSGNLVTEFISRAKINTQKHYIADPMCGSGSTLVAAKQFGYDCIGFDVNPFAVDASNAKIADYSEKDLDEGLAFIDSINLNISDSKKSNDWMDVCSTYFKPQNFRQVKYIYDLVSKIKNRKIRNLLKFIWLSILEECSNRKKDGNGLATRETTVTNAISFFRDKAKLIIQDIKNTSLPKNIFSKAIDETALKFDQINGYYQDRLQKDLGLIIFSPPYANSFDYFESYKIELLMGGFYNLEELKNNRKRLIRNYRIGHGKELKSSNYLVEQLALVIWKAIPDKETLTGKRDGRTRLMPNMIRCYFEDMDKVICSLSKSLLPGGQLHIVVDQSSYVGIIIPTDLLFGICGENSGLRVNEIIRCRRANTSGQQQKRFPYLKEMLRESIVSMEKI